MKNMVNSLRTRVASVFFIVLLFAVAAPSQTNTPVFNKIANVTTTTYTDTTCPVAGQCIYQVTSLANGQESSPSNQVTVVNNGAIGDVTLTWNVGQCPTGKNCAVPQSYNVYQAPPPVPPAGLAGATK